MRYLPVLVASSFSVGYYHVYFLLVNSKFPDHVPIENNDETRLVCHAILCQEQSVDLVISDPTHHYTNSSELIHINMSGVMSKEQTVSVPESINYHFNIVLQNEKGIPQFIRVEF